MYTPPLCPLLPCAWTSYTAHIPPLVLDMIEVQEKFRMHANKISASLLIHVKAIQVTTSFVVIHTGHIPRILQCVFLLLSNFIQTSLRRSRAISSSKALSRAHSHPPETPSVNRKSQGQLWLVLRPLPSSLRQTSQSQIVVFPGSHVLQSHLNSYCHP